jgi:hypothetical protein
MDTTTDNELYQLHCKPKLEGIEKSLERIEKALYGNGSDGLNVKVDRNTQWRKGIVFVMCPVIVAVIIMAIKYVIG